MLHIHDVRNNNFRRFWNSHWSTGGDHFHRCTSSDRKFVYKSICRIAWTTSALDLVSRWLCAWTGDNGDLQLSRFERIRFVVRSFDSSHKSWICHFHQFRWNYSTHIDLCCWISAKWGEIYIEFFEIKREHAVQAIRFRLVNSAYHSACYQFVWPRSYQPKCSRFYRTPFIYTDACQFMQPFVLWELFSSRGFSKRPKESIWMRLDKKEIQKHKIMFFYIQRNARN